MNVTTLAYFLTKNAGFGKLATPYVKPEYFTDDARIVLSKIKEEFEKGEIPIPATIYLALEESSGREAALSWKESFAEMDADGYADVPMEKMIELTEEFLRRKYLNHLAYEMQEVNEKLKRERNPRTKEKLIKRRYEIGDEIKRVTDLKIVKPDVKSFLSDFDGREMEYRLIEEAGTPTGLRALDKAMGGKTFIPGTLSIFMAPPFTGKCVTGDAKVTVRIDGKTERLTMEELFEKILSMKREKT